MLYLTDQHDECDEAGCMDLLGADAPEEVDVLFVSFTETARERLSTWRRHADAPPANVGIVSVETGGSSTEGAFGDSGPTVRRVSDPSDLTGVGIAISEFLSAWADDGNRTVVCFDSLTALLQYLEPRRVFQFCNEITSKFETSGAAAHFHITPEAHDRQVLSVLASLFDDRVSAADLGYRRGERGRTDDAPVDASETVDESAGPEPTSPPTASTEAPASPIEPSTADASDGGGFVFAGDEFSREATAERARADVGEDDFVRGGTGDDGPGEDESADVTAENEHARDERDEPTDSDEPVEGVDGEEAVESADGEEAAEAADGEESAERPAGMKPSTDPEPSGAPGRSTIGPPPGGEGPEGSASDALVPRTTATVVGVVVMLVLMSFLAGAFPTPLVLDESDAGDGVGAVTMTPEDAATGTDVDDADEMTSTATPTATVTGSGTATETSTPNPTPTPGESSSGFSSTDTPTESGGSTPTATTEPVSTETGTATPTPTPEDDGLLDDPLDTL